MEYILFVTTLLRFPIPYMVQNVLYTDFKNDTKNWKIIDLSKIKDTCLNMYTHLTYEHCFNYPGIKILPGDTKNSRLLFNFFNEKL